ncbi:MAG: response regulator, partial [Bacteroidales bacterium]|nr:response regulator [Bacteroidales bacterium]
INNMLIENLLSAYGYQTLSVIEGSRAEEKIEEYQPDVIILDLMISDKSGFDILEDLRKKQISIPVIVVTAMQSDETRKKVEQLGVADYYTKPVAINNLVESIQKLLPDN